MHPEYFDKDDMESAYNEGQKSVLTELWPKKADLFKNIGAADNRDMRSDYGEGYDYGAGCAYDWLKAHIENKIGGDV